MQNHFHVSAAEIEEQDTHQIIVIGVAAIVPNNSLADSMMDEISAFVESSTDAEIIREFVERIYVHQTERTDGKKVQRIRIVWNCIGEFTPPVSEQEKETA